MEPQQFLLGTKIHVSLTQNIPGIIRVRVGDGAHEHVLRVSSDAGAGQVVVNTTHLGDATSVVVGKSSGQAAEAICDLVLAPVRSLTVSMNSRGDIFVLVAVPIARCHARQNSRGDLRIALTAEILAHAAIDASANLLGNVTNDLGLVQESPRQLTYDSGSTRTTIDGYVNWGQLALTRP